MHRHLTGKKAPEFTLPDSNGNSVTFKPGEERIPTIVFFFPKAGTYGCTREACQFQEALTGSPSFKMAGVKVIGISGDAPLKQKIFAKKNELSFPILSDSKREVRDAYHVGKSLFGISEARTTFIIDEAGVVRDSHDALMNFGSHSKFAHQWIDKLNIEAEAKKVAAEPIGEAKNLQVPVITD